MRGGLNMGQECIHVGLIKRGGRMLTGELTPPRCRMRFSMNPLAGPGFEGRR